MFCLLTMDYLCRGGVHTGCHLCTAQARVGPLRPPVAFEGEPQGAVCCSRFLRDHQEPNWSLLKQLCTRLLSCIAPAVLCGVRHDVDQCVQTPLTGAAGGCRAGNTACATGSATGEGCLARPTWYGDRESPSAPQPPVACLPAASPCAASDRARAACSAARTDATTRITLKAWR